MFNKLDFLESKYQELNEQISDPQVISDQERWRKLMKEQNSLTPIVEKYREYKKAKETVEEMLEMLSSKPDKELKELAELELSEAKDSIPVIEEELKILLLPKDPNDDKNVIVEIRAGAGGEEAALFAGDLYRMYSMYADARRWKTEILSENETFAQDLAQQFEKELQEIATTFYIKEDNINSINSISSLLGSIHGISLRAFPFRSLTPLRQISNG